MAKAPPSSDALQAAEERRARAEGARLAREIAAAQEAAHKAHECDVSRACAALYKHAEGRPAPTGDGAAHLRPVLVDVADDLLRTFATPARTPSLFRALALSASTKKLAAALGFGDAGDQEKLEHTRAALRAWLPLASGGLVSAETVDASLRRLESERVAADDAAVAAFRAEEHRQFLRMGGW
jgi:hypothetical protein